MYDFHKVYIEDHKSIFLHENFNPKEYSCLHAARRTSISLGVKSPPPKRVHPKRRKTKLCR